MENQRDRAIETVVGEIEKQFGKGALMRLGTGEATVEVPVISTGSLGVDIALGTGGLPRGRMVEVYGPESSGKTTLALHVVAEAQKAGGVCAFVDAEHALDVGYARKLGNPETTTGGNALKFYASVRLDIRRIGALKDGEQVTGNRTRVKVVKNKLAAPFRETEFDIFYGHGVSRAGEVIDLGVEAGILEKSGAWIGYGCERLGNGREGSAGSARNTAGSWTRSPRSRWRAAGRRSARLPSSGWLIG